VVRRARVIRVDDAATFVIRPNMVVKLAGVSPPERGTPEAARAKEKLEALVLGKKVEFDTLDWDRLGRSIATVKVDGVDVNEEMAEFLKNLDRRVSES
jgi:micrococcal nuclease